MAESAKAIIRRRINARTSEVFDALTDPKVLSQWFGPRAFDVCEVDADVRVGGRFAFRMKGESGMYGAEGVYREVTPPRRLVLTWTWVEAPKGEELDQVESLVTFDLQPDGDDTLLTLTHEGLKDQDTADSHEQGWSEALGKLATLLSVPMKDGRQRPATVDLKP